MCFLWSDISHMEIEWKIEENWENMESQNDNYCGQFFGSSLDLFDNTHNTGE